MKCLAVVRLGCAGALPLALGHATLLAAQAASSVEPDSATPQTATRQLPAGYLGITFTCRLKSAWSPDGLEVIHYQYPAVASVEPESPAARAGIERGDTILAYDGRDVRNHVILLNKLLEPSTRLAVRLRRNGQVRDVDVSIARRPADFVDVSVEEPNAPDAVAVPPAAPARRISDPLPPQPTLTPLTAPRSPGAPWWVLVGPGFSANGDLGAFGGAHVAETSPDLRQALGVSNGLLVVAVDPGTPAAASALRAGDVILAAGRDPVTTPQQLARAVEHEMAGGTTAITLEVERQHRTRHITLRW